MRMEVRATSGDAVQLSSLDDSKIEMAVSAVDLPAEDENSKPTCLGRVWGVLKKYWFVFALFASIALAYPTQSIGHSTGPLYPKISIKFGVLPVMFFFYALTLETELLKEAFTAFKLNTLTQVFNFGAIPGFLKLLTLVLPMKQDLLDGIIMMGCVPTTVSMCVILTRQAAGNAAVSLFNSSLGNLLGVVVTPALVLLFLGSSASLDFADVLLKISIIMVIPTIIGQITQILWVRHDRRAAANAREAEIASDVPPVMENDTQLVPGENPALKRKSSLPELLLKFKPIIGKLDKFFLLVIVWSSFATSFYKDSFSVPAGDLLLTIVVAICCFFVIAAAAWWLYTRGWVTKRRADRVAAWYTATQKTVAMGIPLINIIFDEETAGLIAIPLLCYHPCQLIVGTICAPMLKKYIEADDVTLKEEDNAPILDRSLCVSAPKDGSGTEVVNGVRFTWV